MPEHATPSPLRLNVVSETKRCSLSVVVESFVMVVTILLMLWPLLCRGERWKCVQLFASIFPAFLIKMPFPQRRLILTASSSTTSPTSRKGNKNVFKPLAGQADRPRDG